MDIEKANSVDSIISAPTDTESSDQELENCATYYSKNYFKHILLTLSSCFAGLIVITNGGQQMAFNIFNTQIMKKNHNYHEIFFLFRTIFPIIWFSLAIAGSIASICFHKLHKQIIYFIALGCLAINALILVFVPSDKIFVLFAGENFGAFAFGLVYSTIIIHMGELAHQRFRGGLITVIHFCLLLGIFTSPNAYKLYENDIQESTMRNAGIRMLILVIVALLVNTFFTKESPIFLIKTGCETEAHKVMSWLDYGDDLEIKNSVEEVKSLLNDDLANRKCLTKHIGSFVTLILFKLAFCSSFNIVTNEILLNNSSDSQSHGTNLILIRLFGIVLVFFLIDLKRKVHFVAIICSGLCLVILSLFGGHVEAVEMVFEFLCGLGLGFSFDLYATENLNSYVKLIFVSIANVFEFALQAALLYCDKFDIERNSRFTIIVERFSGIFLIVFGFLAFIVVRENSQLTLRQCRYRTKDT